jgi:hypothetical protein
MKSLPHNPGQVALPNSAPAWASANAKQKIQSAFTTLVHAEKLGMMHQR